MRARIVVTRPEPGASKTAKVLERAGFEPVLLPLTVIVPLSVSLSGVPDNADIVAATSANALRHAGSDFIQSMREKPFYAVGEETAKAARSAGFQHVMVGRGDGDALAEGIVSETKRGLEILYLCGRVRRDAFEKRLAVGGLSVTAVETYDTVALDHSREWMDGRLAGRTVDAALVYSVAGAEALLGLVEQSTFATLFAKTTFLCLSARVAAALGPAHASRTLVAPTPDEPALLALLSS